MINILDKILQKRGVKEFSELTQEEKDTYRDWDNILRGRKLTDEEVESFLKDEEEATVKLLIDQNLNERQDIFLKMKLDMVRKILHFLNGPELEKKTLENNLKQLI